MAGVDVGSGKKGGRKSLDSEINMIPMIDLLMVTISFLLITAVWVNMSRVEASANVPGPLESPPCDAPGGCIDPKLHVETKDPSKFSLVWKEGNTVIRSVDIPRERAMSGGGLAFPNLAARIADEYRGSGRHRDATDLRFDRAVVHASNDMPYKDLIAVMDAVAQPKRLVRSPGAGKTAEASAFEITFATD
jgi:biopolymer transport protein ExbD